MKISELLCPSHIKIGLEAEDKPELLEEMVQVFVATGAIKDRQAAVEALEAREAMLSTGLGGGLALPHAKLDWIEEPMVALGISEEGVEFDALDGELTYVFITIFAAENAPEMHLRILAEIARLFALPGFMERIRKCRTPDDVLAVIRAEE